MGVLDGKVAIVTGASKGLGKGEAFALAKEGAKVVVLARTFEGVVQTAREIEAFGGEALPLQCDVCSIDDVERAVAATVERWGTVDILVNNAQIIFHPHPVEEWTDDEMRACWESGFLGSWAFMKACFPLMKGRGGRIVNTVSVTGHGNLTLRVGYGAAKEAIRSLTRTAAREWGKHGINVNCISPTAMSDSVQRVHTTHEAQMAALASGGSVIGKWGDAEADVGRAVVFLCGPDSSIITGCTIGVDGGAAML
jgi:NAD(P)-dependent dehydrogenase (short-subunit alcohol dehydrogenase family)